MTPEELLPDVEEVLDLNVEARRRTRDILHRILGATPEERIATLRAMKGLSPAQIREACEVYKGLHPDEMATVTVQPEEA